jgi:HlyD family secretion protein
LQIYEPPFDSARDNSIVNRLRNAIVVVAALAVVVAIALAAAHRSGTDALAVPMQRVTLTTFVVKLPESGVVMRPETAQIPTLVSGNVEGIYVRAGDVVRTGQLLATIYNPALQYAAAGSKADYLNASANVDLARIQERNARVSYRAQANTAKSALDLAQRTYDADVTLYANQAIPRQQLDQDKAKLDQARIAYQQALEQFKLGAVTAFSGNSVQSAMAMAQKAKIVNDQNQQQLAFTRIAAPFDGTIQSVASQPNDPLRSLTSGDAVTAGQSLFTIAGSGGYIVKAQVDEQDVINVRLGQRADVTGQDFPGKTIAGRVTHISPVAVKSTDPSSTAKQVLTTIALDSSPGFLRDGMSADVDILTADVPHAIVVPNDAVHRESGHAYVFVVHNGVARKRLVRVGKAGDTQTWLSAGLRPGEIIVAQAAPGLKDGRRVAPLPSASPSASP